MSEGEGQSLKGFLLAVLLWLPLAFFVWFYVAGVLVLPVELLLGALLDGLFGPLFEGVERRGYVLEVGVFVLLPEGRAVAEVPINPMIYGYGLPLVAGLAVATPLSAARRALILLVVAAAVILVQSWGAFWELFRTLAFDLGPPGAAVVADAGLGAELIALCYQFGYLVLPAVVPVALWVLMNRPFIESLVAHRIEPVRAGEGQ